MSGRRTTSATTRSPRPVRGRGKGRPASSRATRRRPPSADARSGAAALGMHERFRDRRRALADAGRRRQRRLAGSAVALAVIVSLGAAATYSPLFHIDQVAVVGVDGKRADIARQASGVEPGQHLLFADRPAAVRAVGALPWVAGVEVRRVPPSTLEIDVTVREPVAVLRLADASWLVDVDGVLVGGGTAAGLVHIDAPGSVLPSVGQRIEDGSVRAALDAHTGLEAALRDRAVRYDAAPGTPLRVLLTGPPAGDDGLWVRLGDGTDIAAKSEALELLLDRIAGDETLRAQVAAGAYELDVRVPINPVLDPVAPPG